MSFTDPAHNHHVDHLLERILEELVRAVDLLKAINDSLPAD